MADDNSLTFFECKNCSKKYKRNANLDKHLIKCDQNTNDNDSINLKPMVKWSGGKYDEISKFSTYIPDKFDYYLEPFFGGGAVFFHLRPDKGAISDLHTELIDFYTHIKKGDAKKIYKFMENNKNEEGTYYKVRDKMDVKTSLDNAKRFYYLRKTCFRGMLRYNASGKFNIPYGKYKTCNYEILKDDSYKKCLEGIDIHCQSFEYIFKNYNSKKNFMFLDPPYDSEFTNYGYCSFGKDEHTKLAKLFKKTNIKCLMVIGKTDFITKLYKDYIVGDYKKKYKFKIHSNRVGDEINTTHLIIKNY